MKVIDFILTATAPPCTAMALVGLVIGNPEMVYWCGGWAALVFFVFLGRVVSGAEK